LDLDDQEYEFSKSRAGQGDVVLGSYRCI
jgi:hypothetical protein